MSKSKQDQLYEFNMQRETWCRVETTSRFWNLPERKHFCAHLQNSCDFSALQTARPEQRSSWMDRDDNSRHPERRHFEDSYKSHQVLGTSINLCEDYFFSPDSNTRVMKRSGN